MAKQKTKRLKPRLKSLRRFRKLSDLMEVALKDLRLVERQKNRFRVDMNTWHAPDSGDGPKSCVVCMAGSVMACTMGAPDKLDISSPYDRRIPVGDGLRLDAIDSVRAGCITSALSEMARSEHAYKLGAYAGRFRDNPCCLERAKWYQELNKGHTGRGSVEKVEREIEKRAKRMGGWAEYSLDKARFKRIMAMVIRVLRKNGL